MAAGGRHSLALRSTAADTAPVISVQPVATVAAAVGQVTRLSVTAAAGTAPVSYQWRKGGAAISGATNGSFSAFIGPDSAGSYDVIVSNYLGAVTSSATVLSVISTPRLNETQGGRLLVNEGAGFTAEVDPAMVAAGASIQWYRGGRPLAGSTNAALSVTNVARHRDDDWYQVRVTSAGTTRSSAPLFVRIPVDKPVLVAWGGGPASATFGSGNTQGLIAFSRKVTGVESGRDHALIIDENGGLQGWGNLQNDAAKFPAGLANVVELASGESHTLALLADGSLLAWGQNGEGQTTLPVFAQPVVRLAASGNASFALMANGKVVSWGTNSGARNAVPEDLTDVVRIATAGGHFGKPMVNIALKANGEIVHWGGPGSSFGTSPGGNPVDVRARTWFGFAVGSSGDLVPWGEEYASVLAVPAGTTGVKQLSLGYAHGVAVLADKRLVIWGDKGGAAGGLSYVPASSLPPVGFTRFEFVAAGGGFTVGVRDGSSDALPVISVAPAPAVAAAIGQVATLRVAASGGDLPLSYQWRKNGTAISGATNAEYRLTVDAGSAANYTVTVSNYLGSITSSATVVSLGSTMLLSESQGGRLVLNPGASTSISAASGFVPAGASVQWKRNGFAIPGATNPSLDLANASPVRSNGRYTLEVSSAGTIRKSAVLHVAVATPGKLVSWGSWQSGVPPVPATLPPIMSFAAGLSEGYLFGLGLKSDGNVVSSPWGDTSGWQNSVP